MKLKDAINLANKRYGVPQLRFHYVFVSGYAEPIKKNYKRVLKWSISRCPVASSDAHSENESARDPCEASPVHGEASLVISDCGEFSSSCQ